MDEQKTIYREALKRVESLRPWHWQMDPLRQEFEQRDRARLARRGVLPDSEQGSRYLLLRELRASKLDIYQRYILASERLLAKREQRPWYRQPMLILNSVLQNVS